MGRCSATQAVQPLALPLQCQSFAVVRRLEKPVPAGDSTLSLTADFTRKNAAKLVVVDPGQDKILAAVDFAGEMPATATAALPAGKYLLRLAGQDAGFEGDWDMVLTCFRNSVGIYMGEGVSRVGLPPRFLWFCGRAVELCGAWPRAGVPSPARCLGPWGVAGAFLRVACADMTKMNPPIFTKDTK